MPKRACNVDVNIHCLTHGTDKRLVKASGRCIEDTMEEECRKWVYQYILEQTLPLMITVWNVEYNGGIHNNFISRY